LNAPDAGWLRSPSADDTAAGSNFIVPWCLVCRAPVLNACRADDTARETVLPQSRQTRWSWRTDVLTETAGSGLGGAVAFSCAVASVLNTCRISPAS
jgi:hypothetical protein